MIAKTKLTPEELLYKFNSRSGIKELKKSLKPEDFEKLAEAKAYEIFRESRVKSQPTGTDLFNTLNKEKNYEFFVEVMGKKETDEFLNLLQEISSKEVANDIVLSTLKKLGKVSGAGYAGWKFIKSILMLI
jgi:hypothetical protein